MKSNQVSVLVVLLLCLVMGGFLYVVDRSSDDEKGWSPSELYGELGARSYEGSSFSDVTFSGGGNSDGVAVSMRNGSFSLRTRASRASSLTPNNPIASSPNNLPSLQGGDGGRLFVQDKRHLYAHGGEDLFFQPAEERHIFEYKGVKILLLVCYDLRFPVWARNQSGSDYDIILVVANWPDIRIQYWDALIAARATENQCYIAAVNCVGNDGMGLHYNGHSVAYDTRLQPIVSFADDEEGTKIADFDIEKLHHFREVLPLWKDIDRFELQQ